MQSACGRQNRLHTGLGRGFPASRGAIKSADGRVLVFAALEGTRPDVAKALARPAAMHSGWSVILLKDGVYYAFAGDEAPSPLVSGPET
jgi:hypothetical protein